MPPPYGTLGTSGVFPFAGPKFFNVDFSVSKLTKFGERVSAQFRVEFFNIFNHPNLANPFGGSGGIAGRFTDPSAIASSGGGGLGFANLTPDIYASNPVLGSGGARAMQLGLKLMF